MPCDTKFAQILLRVEHLHKIKRFFCPKTFFHSYEGNFLTSVVARSNEQTPQNCNIGIKCRLSNRQICWLTQEMCLGWEACSLRYDIQIFVPFYLKVNATWGSGKLPKNEVKLWSLCAIADEEISSVVFWYQSISP